MRNLPKETIQDILALTPVQEGILFHCLSEPDQGHYFEQLSIGISGTVEITWFEQAWNAVVESNEMLRTFFQWENLKSPLQVILKTHEIDFRYYEITTDDEEEEKQRLAGIKAKDREESFDLQEVPFRVTLCKRKKDRFDIIISSHHILYDGWSSGIILKEFFNAYGTLKKGRTPVKPVKNKFKEFVRWNQRQVDVKQTEFWKNYFSGWEPGAGLPVVKKKINQANETGNNETGAGFGCWCIGLTAHTKEKIEEFVKSHRVTTAALLYIAWGIVLQKYTNTNDVVFGTAVSIRPPEIKGIEDVVGLFINTLPFRLTVREDYHERLPELILRVQDDLQARDAFKNTPLVDIKRYGEFLSTGSLFDILVTVENYPLDKGLNSTDTGLMVDSYSVVEQPHYALALTALLYEKIEINCTYNRSLFEQETIVNLCRHLSAIINRILEGPGTTIKDMEILSPKEKKRILLEFNHSGPGYTGEQTIHRLFAAQAKKFPGRIALLWLSKNIQTKNPYSQTSFSELNPVEDTSVTYGELDKKCNQLVSLLRGKGVKPGDVVGIMMERSIEMVMGIIGILKAGAAYLPIEPDYPQDRLDFMLKDSGVKLLVTTSSLKVTKSGSEEVKKNLLPVTGHQPPVTSLAYIIYTSGTTGRPKGVMVTHAPVVNLLLALQNLYPLEGSGAYLLKTPVVFDVSVTELFGWFPGGGKLVLLEKDGEKNPQKLAAAIARHYITHINFIPSMFNAFADYLILTGIGQCPGLRYIFLAGEALLPETVNKFRSLNQSIELENLYGPTEATVYASRYSLAQWKMSETVPIGKPLRGVRLYILDKDGHLQAVGVPGELVISGTGLSMGYLNQPGLTAEKFDQDRYHRSYRSYLSYKSYKSYIYHTGDLARWLPDGNVEFLGRTDQQVKIRGFRVELGEIENRLLQLALVKDAVVIARKSNRHDTYLYAYITANSPPGHRWAAELKESLSRTLPGYMIPGYFVRLEEIPRTAAGKVDRESLPGLDIPAALNYRKPGNEREKQLVEIWSEVLGIEAEKIGIDDNFFELGGHSLKAIGVVLRIHRTFDISIQLGDFFKQPTISELSMHIREVESCKYSPVKPVEEKEYYPLTTSQKRFYILQQLDPANISYNMAEIMLVEGVLPGEKFVKTLERVICRHEMLRTSFHMLKGEPVQIIHPAAAFEPGHYELTGDEHKKIRDILAAKKTGAAEKSPAPGLDRASSTIKNFCRPFELSRTPLLRMGLVKISPHEHLLMFDMHHLISDGVSVGILIRDFLCIYNEEPLMPLKVQYRDYVGWQRSNMNNTAVMPAKVPVPDNDREDENVLNLPTDFERPGTNTFAGKTLQFHLGPEETEALYRLTLSGGVTLYMALLAVYNILLSKLSGQEVIAVGSPISGRNHVDLDNIIGLFLNILCLKTTVSPGIPFSTFLAQLKENTLDTFEKQDYQYHEMVEKATYARNAGRNPLFDVMLVVQNMELPELQPAGLKITRDIGENHTSKFDMTLYCLEKDHLEFHLEYSTCLFKQETIKRFIRCFNKIIRVILADPDIKISQIEIIPGEERRLLLEDFNNTEAQYPSHQLVHDVFTGQAAKSSGAVAITGMSCFEPGQKISISFGRLNELNNRLARLLRTLGVKANRIVGIMMERSCEMVLGILSILKAGGTYLPIDPGYPAKRIASMMDDSGAFLLLTEKRVLEKNSLDFLSRQQRTRVLIMEELFGTMETYPGENPEPISGPGDLLYVIFTSGSTGTPRGAGVYHYSFMNLMNWFVSKFGLNARDIDLLLTSSSFDLTQKNFYASLITGGTLCIPSLNYFDPPVLLRDIRDHRVTWLNCTPSMFYKLVEHEEVNGYRRLSSLRWIFLGGEPISLAQLRDWLASADCHAEIVNTYGPTECTDICASFRVMEPERFIEETIPVGKPIFNAALFILCKGLQLLPIGVPGELYIGGRGVGPGYINAPQLTARKFTRHCFSCPGQELPQQRLYRTGDLAKWQENGNILFLGRIDHQVKIRGFRIELGEIESQLLNLPGVKEAIVITRPGEGGDKYLCAYVVPHSGAEIEAVALLDQLAGELPWYMVPGSINFLQKMPLSPNGKIDRKALPEPEITGAKEFAPPMNQLQDRLLNIWSRVLDIEKGKIGIHDSFFQLGGHSLKAAELTARIHKELNVKMPLAQLFKTPGIRELAAYIKNQEKNIYLSIVPIEKRDYYHLSAAQTRLYILQQMESDNTGYNMPQIIPLKEYIDRERLEDTLKKIISRHESLRTSFEMLADEPVQRIYEYQEVDFAIRYDEVKEQELQDTINKFVYPFDLSRAPLIRIGLVKVKKQGLSPPPPSSSTSLVLLLDMHHIITDGTSQDIITKEFMLLYEGEELSQLRLQYKDYSSWQIGSRQQAQLRQQESYWMQQFPDEIPVLHLPIDYPRPLVQSFEGGSIGFALTGEESKSLKTLSREANATLFMSILCIFNILLARLSSQEDIVVGSPIAGRPHADLQTIIGMFVNTLALRNSPIGEKTFAEFLLEVKECTLAAFENQEYQFEDLVEKLSVQRDASRNPVFDVMLDVLNQSQYEGNIPAETEKENYDHQKGTSKFDMSWTVIDFAEKLSVSIEYSSRLFKPTTIERFIKYFKQILAVLSSDKQIRLSGIEIISKEEKQQILFGFNDTDTGFEYAGETTLHRLFAEQAARTPDSIAVTGEMQSPERKAQSIERNRQRHAPYPMRCALTYRELDKKSHQLAYLLKEKGVEPDNIAAIMAERSIEMIVGILGILKAGGTYLPIDTQYPPERIDFMLKDSSTKILLKDNDLTPKTFNNRPKGASIPPSTLLPFYPSNPSGLAYIIYTSGSTGNPKGVMVEHQNVIGYVHAFLREFKLTANDTMMQQASSAFDASVEEIFPILTRGGKLAIPKKDEIIDIKLLSEFILRNKISIISCSPLLLNELNRISSLKGVTTFISGGDELKAEHVDNIVKWATVYNTYGPTETTVCATYYQYPVSNSPGAPGTPGIPGVNIPIGQPISNYKVYILDNSNQLIPVGVSGEICVSGVGVARGYLNRPELTAEKFLPVLYRSYMSYRSYIFKTGDLARWQPDGNIEFLGRRDNQVKIRGFRIELGEIENVLLIHPGVKDAVVVALEETDGDRFLCAYIVYCGESGLSVPRLREYMSGKLPAYMVPAHFVILDQMPLTLQGKVNRRALPRPVKGGTEETAAPPRDEIEIKLVETWSRVLGIEMEKIGVDTNFFQLGGHSLKANQLAFRVHDIFKVKLPLLEIFRTPYIRGLSKYIRQARAERHYRLEPAEKKEYYPLSENQRRIYTLQQMDKNSITYNMPAAVILEGKPDLEKMRDVFIALINRNESLRTAFTPGEQGAVQVIHEPGEIEFSLEQAASADAFVRPFDLSRPPLIRAGIKSPGKNKHLLMIDLHHIISDGVSMNILVEELMTLYKGESLPAVELQYKDFSTWQKSKRAKEVLKGQEAFWLKVYEGKIPGLKLPYDYPRHRCRDFFGKHFYFSLGKEKTRTLKELALAEGATLYMVFLSMFYILLAKLGNQEDIVIGTVTAGRPYSRLERVVGMFANTLALRNYPEAHKTFTGFLKEVKQTTLEALENQDFPFDRLVNALGLSGETQRNPLFDVGFGWDTPKIPIIQVPGLTLKPYDREPEKVKFDMIWIATGLEDRVEFTIEYSTELLKETTVENFSNYFKEIVSAVIRNKEIPIKEIKLSHRLLAPRSEVPEVNLRF
jgi:amino acid adenylation domain-containing protein